MRKIIGICVAKVAGMMPAARRRRKEEAEAKQRREEQLATEIRLGERVAEQLRLARALNRVHVGSHRGVGPMWVGTLSRDQGAGLGYMVSVYISDHPEKMMRSYFVCSISVNGISGMGHALWTSYPNNKGDEEDFDLSQIETYIKKARRHVIDYRLFSDEDSRPDRKMSVAEFFGMAPAR